MRFLVSNDRMTTTASCGAAWKRCFVVACLCLSLAVTFCQAFSTQSISRTRFDKLPSLHSTSEETSVEKSSTDSTEAENDLETQLQDTDLLASNEYFGRNGYSMTSGYSRFLYTREEKPSWWTRMRRNKQKNRQDMNEDGYADMRQRGHNRSILQKVLRLPFKTAKRVLSKGTREPGTLILVRHGESEWNKNKTFTGWADPGE